MSKSQVSRLCECLDAEVDAFRRQRFDGVRFAYLWLDAVSATVKTTNFAIAH
ncbi:transposase [Eggerthella lenta]|nr:transposase [Eggerthella lenta]MCQ5106046.1 transposase [Eggerthella lenta]